MAGLDGTRRHSLIPTAASQMAQVDFGIFGCEMWDFSVALVKSDWGSAPFYAPPGAFRPRRPKEVTGVDHWKPHHVDIAKLGGAISGMYCDIQLAHE